ncbi:MAG: sigma-70 family RNA polymerase sigma factor [bacterium]|nr:sigma-70 family RNA polymerase sigma factor [bacterium]
MSDNLLITRLTKEEPKAQEELVKKYNSRLMMYFRLRIKGEETYDDLVQEVFVSFFIAVGRNKITEDKFIGPYIFGIAKRVMYNFFYKKKRDGNLQKKSEENLPVTCDFQEAERLENESMSNIIEKYIAKLPDIDKTILKEFYLKENSIGEVAGILGKSKHYISVRKERALKKIKNEILKRKDLFS